MSALLLLLLAADPAVVPAPVGTGPAEAGPLTLRGAQQLALERHPGLAAVGLRVSAMQREAEADGALPSPEFMAEAWQVPLAQPWSLVDAQMLSLSLKQTFPGWGVRAARAEAKLKAAQVEAVQRTALELDVLREVGHAFVDLREAVDKHATHARHESIAGRLVEVAQARVSSGGRLEEVLLAQADRARLGADVTAERAATERAVQRLRAVLSLADDEHLPEQAPGALETLGADATLAALVDLAATHRPEQREAGARQQAAAATLEAARAEATAPGVSVALGYYAPTRLMPVHGFGLSLGVELPWLWGGRRAAVDAQQGQLAATQADARGAAYKVRLDVATAAATVRAATTRWRSLHDEVLPAAARAFEGSLSSYRSGAGEVLRVLAAEQAVVELEVELVTARAAIAHALVDLDAALGTPAPREVVNE
jgi:outer membrane protein TolC